MIKQIKFSKLLIFYMILCLYFNYFKTLSYLFVVLFVHEIFHIIFIKYFNGKILKINFSIFGGVIKFTKFDKRIFPTFLINFSRNNRKYMLGNIWKNIRFFSKFYGNKHFNFNI